MAKTPVTNLMRHKPSGNYYARIRVSGKLIWKSMKTDVMSVAKLRLGDFHKTERQRAKAQAAVSRGKMTFADALQTYRERLKGDHSLKERSKNYRGERIIALLKSWPELKHADIARISKSDCLAWAAQFGKAASPTAFNNTNMAAKHENSGMLLHFQISICPMIYTSNLVRQTSAEFKVQGAQQFWQLVCVGEKTDLAMWLLHHLKIW